ncbi:sensor histidine kinase KdpD [Pseudonocardia sp. ICBG601]|uniref:sensor histidine kinase n=1 Tax=Pseudonocardia sp. ICBG601 TaxID=2846759 RepID=UPI001CF6A5BF|nr:HAMP domain-containing sensor histidine kinase [Pseudonocardia sp. ICBG601]
MLRLCVVLAAVGLVVSRPDLTGERPVVAAVLVGLSTVYAAVLGVVSLVRGRLPVPPAVLTGLDGVLSVLACGFTGGVASPMVGRCRWSSSRSRCAGGRASRGSPRSARCRLHRRGPARVRAARRRRRRAPGRTVVDRLPVRDRRAHRVQVRLLEHQLADIATTRARAENEHERYLSERALRDRIVSQSRARLDGARVVLHEFRTPVASLTALSSDLAAGRLDGDAARRASRLLADHAAHLQDMLDGLADLAVADGSPLGRDRPRRVALVELADAVLDAAGIAAHRRHPVVEPAGAAVHCDPQRLRRMLTNLAENAARHSGDEVVELHLSHAGAVLTAEVRDRGPGLPAGQEGVVTAKGVALGERRGTAGLGLWIAEALASAMDGELSLLPREGGGLVARLTLPLAGA